MATDYEFGTPQQDIPGLGEELPTDNPLHPNSFSPGVSYPTFPVSEEDARTWNTSLQFDGRETYNNETVANVPEAALAEGTARPQMTSASYISQTELANGQQALLIDPGSWGNLTGTPWARRTAVLAGRSNKKSKQTKRDTALKVTGVGKDAQECTYDGALPVALRTLDNRVVSGTYKSPIVNDLGSEHPVPALLGLRTLIEQRAILDFTTMQLSFTGPGTSRIEFSPGTDTFQLIQAPSGHLMLPCCEYQRADESSAGTGAAEGELSLVSSTSTSSLSSH